MFQFRVLKANARKHLVKYFFNKPDLAPGSMARQFPFGPEAGCSVQLILVLAHSLVQFKAMAMSKGFALPKTIITVIF